MSQKIIFSLFKFQSIVSVDESIQCSSPDAMEVISEAMLTGFSGVTAGGSSSPFIVFSVRWGTLWSCV